MTVYVEIEKISMSWNAGEARYWVNDSGPTLSGDIDYPGSDDQTKRIENYVGLVDEDTGGMIAYGEPKVMEELCERLNLLDAIERLMHA